MLNGLIVKDLSPTQITEGLKGGKYLPSDFVSGDNGEWISLKDSPFIKNNGKSLNGWMALFFVSFILNIMMLMLMFWQKARIENLLK